jgi:hypothetical protein
MTDSRVAPDGPPSPRRTTTGAWVAVGVLLAIGIVVPLLVFLYDQLDPTLGGFPFFYWFQFLLIPIVSVLTYTAFKISEKALVKDREAHGLPGHPHREGER